MGSYLLGIPAVAYVGALVIVSIGDDCPPDASDCDLSGLAAFVLGSAIVVIGFGAAIVFELTRAISDAADSYAERDKGA